MTLILALTLALQNETAELTFARIEKALAQAKSLNIRCTVELTKGDQKMSGEASVQLKGNAHRIVFQCPQYPVKDGRSRSDGVRVDLTPPRPVGETEWPAQGTLNDSLKVALLRRGCFELEKIPSDIQFFRSVPAEKLVVSGFKFGDGAEGVRPLLFTLQGRVEVQLWVDAKTLALQKRVMTVLDPAGKPVATVTELYKTFTLNAEIPDATFKLQD